VNKKKIFPHVLRVTHSKTVRPILRIKFSKTALFETLPTTKKPALLALKLASRGLVAFIYPFRLCLDPLKWAQNPSFRIMTQDFNVNSGSTNLTKLPKKREHRAKQRE